VPAVSDSSPLILFARIDRLDLLRLVFEDVIVPPAVWREVVEAVPGRAGAAEVRDAWWIRREDLPPSAMLAPLDAGEAEAIALALVRHPRLPILLDDGPARRVAKGAGLEVVSCVGILLLARTRGVVPAVRPHLLDLLAAGLYLRRNAADELLREIGE